MSDSAQRVLDKLIKYNTDYDCGYPFQIIYDFLDAKYRGIEFDIDYEFLTADEEKQIIEAFLEFAY